MLLPLSSKYSQNRLGCLENYLSEVWPKSISQPHLALSPRSISPLTSSIVAKLSVTSLAINNMFRGEINSIDNEQHDKLFRVFILL